MKCMKLLAGAAVAAGIVAGCGPSKPVLHVYTWSDYIDPDVIAKFAEANDCEVVVDTFDSNEAMYAKLQAGSTGYDIIMPSSYQIPLMVKNDMLKKLDHTLLPNVAKNFDKSFGSCILDPTFTYSAPYMVTYTGIAYRKDKVGSAPVDSWHVYETAALKGRMSLLADMRETIGAALRCLGYSLNTESPKEIDEAVELVLKWKANIAKFDNEQYKTAVDGGEWFVGHGYSSDITQVMCDNKDVGFSLPKEGFSISFDEMVIAADAPNPELAHKFINFLYDPENAKPNMESVLAPMPVAPALAALDESMKKILVIDQETLANGEMLKDLSDKPEVRDLYIKAWDRIKGGK